ncbi:MAG: MFS transporter [Oligoflexales bacterium]|nr:MFS transporter [Oligoflexales bacterium]
MKKETSELRSIEGSPDLRDIRRSEKKPSSPSSEGTTLNETHGFRHALDLIILILAGGSIYFLPFLRETFHKPLMESFNLTNIELGYLNTAYGIFALICYLPSGWLADRFSTRFLVTFSLLTTGILGFFFATIPSYKIAFLIHIGWGISTTLTFWAALIKRVRIWGGTGRQGRGFGLLEGGRGFVEAVITLVTVDIFSRYTNPKDGMVCAILIYSSISLVAALLFFIFSRKDDLDEVVKNDPVKGNIAMSGIMRDVVSMPALWLIVIIILTGYTAFWGSYDVTPYATDAFKSNEVLGGYLSAFRMWFRPVVAILAGLLADRIGIAKMIKASFLMLIVSFLTFALIPTNPSMIWVLWVNTGFMAMNVFIIRGLYYALLDEVDIPMHLTGICVGVISLIAYTPDIFSPLLSGYLLDSYKGAQGHQIYFLINAIFCALGLAATFAIRFYEVKKTDRLASI